MVQRGRTSKGKGGGAGNGNVPMTNQSGGKYTQGNIGGVRLYSDDERDQGYKSIMRKLVRVAHEEAQEGYEFQITLALVINAANRAKLI